MRENGPPLFPAILHLIRATGKRNMNPIKAGIGALAISLLLTACATLDPDYEKPTVTLSSFKALPSEDMVPSFEIGLQVINPNPGTLNIQGVVYTIALEGHELVKGVGKDFAPIEGYTSGNLKLTASANLLSGLRFISGMMRQPGEALDYEFKARLDLGGIYPSVKVSEKGQLNMGTLKSAPAR